MSNKKILTGFLLCIAANTSVKAQLIINELMQSNVDCIMDDINEYPDSWVELFNTSESAINLNTYKIGITDKAGDAWQLPSKQIGPKQFVLIYCDKEATNLHTNFRLESGKGCEVYLFKNNEIADKVTGLKKQPAPDISYGRETTGSDKWGYQLSPSPVEGNRGQICDGDHILGSPIFSETGRVTTSNKAIELTLSVPEGSPEGTYIRYTTDGKEPTATTGSIYGNPLKFSATRVIRAKLFCDGWLSPKSTAQSYIFFPRNLTLPVVSIITDNKNFNDSKIGIYVDGNYQSGKKNYEFNWRRPINFEYFEGEDTKSILNQICETRIAGGATRGSKFKTLALYANKRFGTKRFDYEFFPDQKPGLSDFKSIMIRNAGNDFDYLYMRDAIIQRTMAQYADLDWQAWKPAIVYINGTYKGMLNIRERSNEDNIYTNYDGLEDIDMFENWGELKEGTSENFEAFKKFYAEHGHTMAEYEQWMDCHEFINLMIMNLYYNNQDFPGNNIVMWRPRAEGGRWRWVVKDTDFGLGLYGSPANYKTFEWLYNPNYDSGRNWANQYEHTRLFRRLMEDEDFNREFIDRCAIYMGDFLNEKGTREIWDPMYEQIKYEYPYHRNLINQWWPNYNDELRSARNWLSQRGSQFYTQLGNYYKLGTPIPMTINKNLHDPSEVTLTFNGVKLHKHYFDGKFYAGRKITLEGQAIEGKEVTGWQISYVSSSGSTTSERKGSTCTFTMPTCSQMTINAIVGNSAGINDIEQKTWTWMRTNDELILCNVPADMRVYLYDLKGICLYKTSATGSEIRIPATEGNVYVLKVGNETVKLR